MLRTNTHWLKANKSELCKQMSNQPEKFTTLTKGDFIVICKGSKRVSLDIHFDRLKGLFYVFYTRTSF